MNHLETIKEDTWTDKNTQDLKLFSDCFEKFEGKNARKNIFSPEEEKLAADMLRVSRQRV